MATVVSLGGDWFATVAIIGKVTDLGTGTWLTPALAASLIFVCQMLPSFLVTPIAGPLADRFDRRMIMIVASLLQACAGLLFLFPTRSTIWLAFVAQILVSTLAGFFSPASQAAVANLVPPEDLQQASSLLGTTWGAMLALGGLGGRLVQRRVRTQPGLHRRWLQLHPCGIHNHSDSGPDPDRSCWRTPAYAPDRGYEGRIELRESQSAALPDAVLQGRLRLVEWGSRVCLVLWLRPGSGEAIETVGILLAARGVGVVLGPVVASRLGVTKDVAGILQACAIGCMIYGVFYIGVGYSPFLWMAFLFTAIAHLGGGTQWTLSTYGLQATTPDEYRGRIGSADFALVSLSMSVSFVGGGWLDRQFGATTAFFVLGVIAILWGVLYLRATATLRESSPTSEPDLPIAGSDHLSAAAHSSMS